MNVLRVAVIASAVSALIAITPTYAGGSAGFSRGGGGRIAMGMDNQGNWRRHGRDRYFGEPIESLEDRRAFERRRDHRRRRPREIGLLGDSWSDGGWIYEENRTALGNGYFGHGASDGGGYDYDRGYPYDYYDEGDYREATGMVEHRARPRRTRCRTEWVPGDRGDEVAVRICRG